MKKYTIALIAVIGLITVLFTNCGKSGAGFSSTTSTSTDTGTNGGGSTSGGSSNTSLDNVGRLTESEATTLVNNFIPQVAKNGLDNRYSTALFGAAREIVQYQTITTAYKNVYVPTPYLKNGNLLVRIHKSKNAKAPLAILLNPLYSDQFAYQMERLMEFYGKKDYHVMVFMNTWSPEVLSKNPSFFPGDIWTEGKMHLELVDKLVTEQFGGRTNIAGATLAGISYGAFMSTIVKAYDQRRANPLITGPTLVINPPHNILQSMKNIDKQIDSINELDILNCTFSGGFLGLVQQAQTVDDYNKTNLSESCSKYLFTRVGFQITLINAVTTMNTPKSLGLTLSQISNMRYNTYMTQVAKLTPPTAEADIGYWMADAKSRGYDKFTVLISADDSINEGNNLANNIYYNYNNTSLIMVPTGGHTGLREAKSRDKTCGKDWTMCFLNAIYN
jgi:predicted alpha/beta-fold hydrolase